MCVLCLAACTAASTCSFCCLVALLRAQHPGHWSVLDIASGLSVADPRLPLVHPPQVAAVLVEKENIDGDEFQSIILESQADQYLKKDAPGVSIPYQTA